MNWYSQFKTSFAECATGVPGYPVPLCNVLSDGNEQAHFNDAPCMKAVDQVKSRALTP
jgi:hypothetical protein